MCLPIWQRMPLAFRLPRHFHVGFQGLGHSHEPTFVPSSLLKLLISAFPMGSLLLGCDSV